MNKIPQRQLLTLCAAAALAACGEVLPTDPDGNGGAGANIGQGGEGASTSTQNAMGGNGGAPSNPCVLDESKLDQCVLQ